MNSRKHRQFSLSDAPPIVLISCPNKQELHWSINIHSTEANQYHNNKSNEFLTHMNTNQQKTTSTNLRPRSQQHQSSTCEMTEVCDWDRITLRPKALARASHQWPALLGSSTANQCSSNSRQADRGRKIKFNPSNLTFHSFLPALLKRICIY